MKIKPVFFTRPATAVPPYSLILCGACVNVTMECISTVLSRHISINIWFSAIRCHIQKIEWLYVLDRINSDNVVVYGFVIHIKGLLKCKSIDNNQY